MTTRTTAIAVSIAVLVMTGMATAQYSNTESDIPTYNGEPRSYYSYTGDETDVFEQWQEGQISTNEFQFDTDSGEGTAALEISTAPVPFASASFERFTDRLSEHPDDSMQQIEIDSGGIMMDTGYSGFCGRTGYRVDLSDEDIKAVRFEAEASRDRYAGTAGLLVNGEFADTFTVASQPNRKTWERDTYTVDTSDTDVETIGFGVQDTSSQYCDIGDHELTLDIYDVELILGQSESGDLNGAAQEYDANNDGTISIDELGEAGADYASGQLALERVKAVQAAFSEQSAAFDIEGSEGAFIDTLRNYDNDNSGTIEIGELGEAGKDYANNQLDGKQLAAVVSAFDTNYQFQPTPDDESTPAYDIELVTVYDDGPYSPGENVPVEYEVSALGPADLTVAGDLTVSIGGNQREFALDIPSGETTAGTIGGSVAVEAPEEPGEYQVLVNAQADDQDGADSANGGTITVAPSGPGTTPPSAPVEFEISEGWSLVSAPSGVSSLKSTIRDECSVGTSGRTAWRARADVDGYAEPGPVRSTGGYWVNLESSCSFSTFASDEDASYTEFEESGLYMVSVPEATSLDSVAGSCSFNQFTEYSGPVLELNGDEYQGLSSSTELSPTKGYWVEVQEPCKMGASVESDESSSGPPPGP